MVVHTKAKMDCRAATDARREGGHEVHRPDLVYQNYGENVII